jgi:hypothetical protein
MRLECYLGRSLWLGMERPARNGVGSWWTGACSNQDCKGTRRGRGVCALSQGLWLNKTTHILSNAMNACVTYVLLQKDPVLA